MVFLLTCVLEIVLGAIILSGVMDLISATVESVIPRHFWNPPGDGLRCLSSLSLALLSLEYERDDFLFLSLERERDRFLCLRFREPDRDLDLRFLGDLTVTKKNAYFTNDNVKASNMHLNLYTA